MKECMNKLKNFGFSRVIFNSFSLYFFTILLLFPRSPFFLFSMDEMVWSTIGGIRCILFTKDEMVSSTPTFDPWRRLSDRG